MQQIIAVVEEDFKHKETAAKHCVVWITYLIKPLFNGSLMCPTVNWHEFIWKCVGYMQKE